jgi:hypothetical protein
MKPKPDYKRLQRRLAELAHRKRCPRPSLRTCPFHNEQAFMRAAYATLPQYFREEERNGGLEGRSQVP